MKRLASLQGNKCSKKIALQGARDTPQAWNTKGKPANRPSLQYRQALDILNSYGIWSSGS
ncbi:hypothetical protein AOQ73_34995 [Bradyrhizobium pachyrhizi]|nr:hypothetical protein AOQ73_34995 [Bradyrhizobium pachyrhizi]